MLGQQFYHETMRNVIVAFGTLFNNIHLVRKSSYWYIRHIAFRNELINNTNTRKEYENLKLELAKIDWKDGNSYSEAKNFFIRKIERKIT